MRINRCLLARLCPPYSLRTILLLALTGLALLVVGANAVLAYHRIDRETLARVREQADSLAQLVASTNTEAMILNDIGAIESSLQQVARLPGIDAIAVVRADGRRLAEVRRLDRQYLSKVGGSESLPAVTANGLMPAQVLGNVYQSWARIGVGSNAALGWVRVRYSLAQRELDQQRLWQRSVSTLLATIVAIVTILPFILNWALRPLHKLADMAGNLSTHLGEQADVRTHMLEVDRLARALNKASHDVAAEVARTQIIVNTAAVAIIGLDSQGCAISANPATTSIFGREERDLLGQPIDTCIPGLDGQSLHELFAGFDGETGRVYRVVRQDFMGTRVGGTRFPVEITLGQAPSGDRLRYVCIVRDTTDERAAQETTELYERALASSHNGVFITNAIVATQPIIFVNEAFQKITGLGPHQVLGRPLHTLAGDPEMTQVFEELRQAIDEERSANVTLHQQLPGGRELYAELSFSPVRGLDDRVTNFVGIVSDVTARVQAKQAIAERGAQLDAIFSLSPDGFVLFDPAGCLIFANPAFERMTGRPWKPAGPALSLAQFQYSLTALCHPAHPVPELLHADDDTQSAQARLVLARPQHRVLQLQSRRNVAGRGETILYFRDVTHEDEVDRMKSEFLASAAHELRTPMVSIFGFTELLLKRSFSEERRTDMLQTMHRQSGLLVKMINELLDLARIESRQGLDLAIAEYRLVELVDHSVRGLMRGEGERQVELGPIPEAWVLIDPEKMQLALNNLLSNAFKYSPDGGAVRLSGRLEARAGQDYAVLEVSDQGIGMKPEQLQRAFERFYRADTTGNIPGTGLGLSLVKEIAELHHGLVELASAFGAGTTATLWIPLAARRD